MGNPIIKLQRGDEVRYFEWSSICDAPLTFGLSREEFEAYYREQYGAEGFGPGLTHFAHRMQRVEERGTSSMIHENAAEVIAGNRAGKGETELTEDEIWEKYVVRRAEPDHLAGRASPPEEGEEEDEGDIGDDDDQQDDVEWALERLHEGADALREIGADDTVRCADAIDAAIEAFSVTFSARLKEILARMSTDQCAALEALFGEEGWKVLLAMRETTDDTTFAALGSKLVEPWAGSEPALVGRLVPVLGPTLLMELSLLFKDAGLAEMRR